MNSVRFITFGCKANQYDTQVLREALLRRGWSERDQQADLVVLNTCTVTAEAGRKARQMARRIAREQPSARIAITGCLAESEPEILRELPGVEWVLGNGEAKLPVNFLRDLGLELDPEELGVPAGISEFAGHTRAFLKIQDGCDMACAFCIIPTVRGRSRSRPIAELTAEVRRLVASGHREIVLCGIHIGHWGREIGSSLSSLIEAFCELEIEDEGGERLAWRVRLSSIEATEVDADLLARMRDRPDRVATHLHMPMQSGDDEVLRAMNRWYTVAEYLAACDRIRATLDRPAFSADLLVGFPGETEASFERTCATARAAGFSRIHVFPFSARPGTAAAGRPTPPVAEVRERRARLAELGSETATSYRASLDGSRDTILFEGGFTGLSGRYQRIRVPPESLDGVPEGLLEVELSLELDAEGQSSLRGRPTAPPQDVAARAPALAGSVEGGRP